MNVERLEHLQRHFDAEAGRILPGISFSDMRAHLSDSYIVKGLIKPGTLVAIIGAPKCGKTFFGTNLALHIASGALWRGKKVKGGLVVYAALEGPASAENRFVASRENGGFAPGIPLKLTPGPINLREPLDVQALIEFVRLAESEHGCKCVAIFVDTLSRAIAGGDENGPEDMGALIAGADAVRLATSSTVILVHHFGKDETRGGRGHSSLKAALDTEIEVTTRGTLKIATVASQRNLPEGEQFAFALRVVELGKDEDGNPVTTCVVTESEAPAGDRKQPSGKLQRSLLAALQEWRRGKATDLILSMELREIAKSQAITKKSTLADAIEGLQKLGWLTPTVGGFRFDSVNEL